MVPGADPVFGVDSMPETGENVAADFNVSRADQDWSRCAVNSAPRLPIALVRPRQAGHAPPNFGHAPNPSNSRLRISA
jgi:hypothetical protein